MNYQEYIESKTNIANNHGFEPLFMPDFLYPFQSFLLDWSVRKGRGAIFADCGLGKTPIQLSWAQNAYQETGKPTLILTPLAVAPQTVREGEKFGIECGQSKDGSMPAPITVANYQRLHYFDSNKFGAVVCDESSILKNFDGSTRAAVTEFMLKVKYRLLCTATAAPNDYIELGTSSEALGDLGYMDMLSRFFKTNDGSGAARGGMGGVFNRGKGATFGGKFRFRGHAERDFWRWVCSWARAVRHPADLGFDDGGFILPPLKTIEHIVKAKTRREDFLFDMPAITLQEQRTERRRTINERCELAASLVNNTGKPAVCWCHLNEEGHMLEKMIPDSVEVDGNDEDDFKEEAFEGFVSGKIRVLVTKPVIGGFGLNWQHCSHQTFFPSHSFEQYYQAIRRSWRFGQTNPVKIDVISSEGEAGVLSNMNRKACAADQMFASLVSLMNNELRIDQKNMHVKKQEIPVWL